MPGTRTWTVAGIGDGLSGEATRSRVTVTDGDGNDGTTSFTIVVTRAPLTVTADYKSRLFGAANPPLTATLSGFVLGQTLATSGVTGTAACSTTAVPFSAPGTYLITCTLGSLASTNYAFTTFLPGTVDVTTTGACVTETGTGR